MFVSPRGELAAPCAALLLLASVPAFAQELTLGEALRRAERYNENPRMAEQRVAQARAARRRAYAALLPTLFASAGYRHGTRSFVTAAGVAPPNQGRDSVNFTGRADVALFDATVFPRLSAAAHAVDAERNAAFEVRRTLHLDVAEAFFSVLASEQVALAAARRVEVASVQARAAERRLEVGLAGRNDLTRAELEREAARLEVLQAQNGETQARLGLGFLIGDQVTDTLVAPEGPIAVELPFPALVERALEARGDLGALRARVREADALADEPLLGLIPILEGSAVVDLGRGLRTQERNFDWTLVVTATWLAYDGGVRYADAAQRRALLRELRLQLDLQGRQVGLEIRAALADLSTASDAVAVAQERLQAAERNLSEVRARFDRGLANALVMADASEQAYLAAAELAGQRLSQRLAELDLMRATGGWPDPSTGGEIP